MANPTALHKAADRAWLCRNVIVGGRNIGLALVRADVHGRLLTIEPFKLETPATIYHDGSIEINNGIVQLLTL